jgi:Mg-chelatase subunit ChlD
VAGHRHRSRLGDRRSRTARRGEARPGKSLTADGDRGSSTSARDRVLEGDDARRLLDEQRRQTTARRSLERHRHFDAVSPEAGALDPSAFDEALADDADEALALLAELTGATDERLRALARRLAARVVLDVARTGRVRTGGVGRPVSVPADRSLGDLDLDASLEALTLRRAGGGPVDAADLRVTSWGTPSTSLCLLVDRSGSMHGDRLAAAAMAAGAAAWRAGADHSVIAFGREAIVVKAQGDERRADAVADDLFRLRGFGPTDLGLALRTAREQLARSSARRRVAVVLSDCRATEGGDPVPAARALGADRLGVLAPADDADDAVAFARATGARLALLAGPSAVPAAFTALLDPP